MALACNILTDAQVSLITRTITSFYLAFIRPHLHVTLTVSFNLINPDGIRYRNHKTGCVQLGFPGLHENLDCQYSNQEVGGDARKNGN